MVSLSTLALLAISTAAPSVRPSAPSSLVTGHRSPVTVDTDTTISVSPGTRLQVETWGGDITVKTWDRNQLRVEATHGRRTQINLRQSGAVISVEAGGFGSLVDYAITAPAWMSLQLGGMNATVSVEGSRGPIEVSTLEGDITVKGGAETVKLATTTGKLVVSGAHGRVELNSISEDIEASDIQGDLVAETVSGDVLLRDIKVKSAEIQSVSGDVWYEGAIQDGGRYSLATHSGDILVSIAEGTNATVNTAVGSGDVSASFPLPPGDRPGRRRQNYRFGTGSASVELETFSGDIELLRPAELAARLDRKLRDRRDREDEKTWQRRPDRDFDQERSR